MGLSEAAHEALIEAIQAGTEAEWVVTWLTAELGSDEMCEAVERALVLANEDDCDGYIPLTSVDIDTMSVTYREDATTALAAITARLTGQGEA